MGSPISGLTAEIFLQSLEHTHIKPLLDSKRIIFSTRYTDDNLIIYNTAQTNKGTITHYVNTIHNNLKLCPTPEQNNKVSFLDLAIIRNTPHLEIDIFRKPTTTDTTINYLSNNPLEQELVAYRFLTDRMLNLPLHKSHLENEWQTILQIAKNNQFPTTLIHKLKHRMTQKRTQPPHPAQLTQPKTNKKWATFTFTSPNIREITNLFKQTGIKIAFRCKNTLAHLVKTTYNTRPPPHDRPGIYQLKCNTCHRSYRGQTSHNLKTRYHEHIRYIKNNNPQSAYAQHILDNGHKYRTMDNLMTLLKPLHSQYLLTTYEQFYIHSFHKNGKLISEQSPGSPNPLFNLTIHPPQLRANWASGASNPSMDILPASRF